MQVHHRLCVVLLIASFSAVANLSAALMPDTIQLTNGKVLKGLIVRQSSTGVTIQLPYGEKTIPNEEIVRIRNVGDKEMWFTKVLENGTLPPWRVIANDLRNSDEIKSFQEIPSTAIDVGIYAYVPYVSFKANDHGELNIYGDPEDPAGVEVGMYAPLRSNREMQKMMRQFLGSYLTGIDEVRALYSLDLKKGGQREVGNMTIRVATPREADSYGGWWLSFYNKKKLDKVRMSPAAYNKLTVPFDQIHDKKTGAEAILNWQTAEQKTAHHGGADGRVFPMGFYRDKGGNFRVYDPSNPPAN